jgi:hypothetical protein
MQLKLEVYRIGEMWRDVAAVLGFIIAALILASLTLRRRTANDKKVF